MGSAQSIQKAQTPIGCQLCETGNKIEWKCIQCSLLICSRCKDKIHPKFKGAIDHEIVNIKDVGLHDLPDGDLRAHQTEIEIKVSRQFSTDMGNINSMSSCHDDSVWLNDTPNMEIKHVRLTEDNTQVISHFHMSVTEVAVTSSNNILISVDRARLKMINEQTGQISDSKYDVSPLQTWCIHVTKDQRIIIGAITPGPLFSNNNRGVVMVFDEEGKQTSVYEHDNHNKPLFTIPQKITSTSKGIICVIDYIALPSKSRLVFLGQKGNVIKIYNGHPDFISEIMPFSPMGIVTTPTDNIIVIDYLNEILYILNQDSLPTSRQKNTE